MPTVNCSIRRSRASIYADDGDLYLRQDVNAPVTLFNGDPAVDGGALFSPLGDRVALFRTVDGGEDLLIAGADGRNLTRIGGPYDRARDLEVSQLADDELTATFMPDGGHILLQQRFGEAPTEILVKLWIATLQGTDPARDLGIASRAGEGFSVAVAPDGTSLLVHLWGEAEDWLVDPVSGTATMTDIGSSSGVTRQRRAP